MTEKGTPSQLTGVPVNSLIFREITAPGFEPFIKTLFRNPVDGADPDPAEFVPFQETVNGFAADAQDILQILNSVAAISGGRLRLNSQIIDIHIASLLSPQGTQRSVLCEFLQVFLYFVA